MRPYVYWKVRADARGMCLVWWVVFLYLKEVRDVAGKGRKGVARVERGRAVTGGVENGVLSRTLELHLPECVSARAWIVQKRRVVEYTLVASILRLL